MRYTIQTEDYKTSFRNLPEYFKEYTFTVFKLVEGDFWYYDSFNDVNKAFEVTRDLTDSYGIPAAMFVTEGIINNWGALYKTEA